MILLYANVEYWPITILARRPSFRTPTLPTLAGVVADLKAGRFGTPLVSVLALLFPLLSSFAGAALLSLAEKTGGAAGLSGMILGLPIGGERSTRIYVSKATVNVVRKGCWVQFFVPPFRRQCIETVVKTRSRYVEEPLVQMDPVWLGIPLVELYLSL